MGARWFSQEPSVRVMKDINPTLNLRLLLSAGGSFVGEGGLKRGGLKLMLLSKTYHCNDV